MTFYARLVLPKTKPPMKVYVRDSGHEVFDSAWGALEYMLAFLRHSNEYVLSADYLHNVNYALAVLHAKQNKKIIRLFYHRGIVHWPGNPEIEPLVFVNERLEAEESDNEDENTSIMRGMEGTHRRKTESLDEYLFSHPYLGSLEPKTTI